MSVSKTIVLAGLVVAAGMSSCKKEEDLSKGFSEKVQSVVPKEIVDIMRENGIVIYEGQKPPTVDGIFETSDYTILSSKGGSASGSKLSNHRFKFSDFSNTTESLKVSWKPASASSASGTGEGAVVSGFGNNFTVYAKTKVSGLDYYEIYSGELTANGVKDWNDAIIRINSTTKEVTYYQLLKDGDGLAAKVSAFRQKALEPATPDGPSRAQ